MKKYLPTILVVLAVLGVVAFIVWALLRPDQSADQTSKTLNSEEQAELGQGNTLGKADSSVVLTEFGDFQCPACGQAYPFVHGTILPKYADRIKFVFKNFPLPMHKNAQIAAQAAEAAALQGKFWEMHNKLYETQSQWENDSNDQAKGKFEGYARELGLDVGRWKGDFDSNQVLEVIKKDVSLGEKLGLSGTPSFLINGQLIEFKTYGDLTNALDKALGQSPQPSQ